MISKSTLLLLALVLPTAVFCRTLKRPSRNVDPATITAPSSTMTPSTMIPVTVNSTNNETMKIQEPNNQTMNDPSVQQPMEMSNNDTMEKSSTNMTTMKAEAIMESNMTKMEGLTGDSKKAPTKETMVASSTETVLKGSTATN